MLFTFRSCVFLLLLHVYADPQVSYLGMSLSFDYNNTIAASLNAQIIDMSAIATLWKFFLIKRPDNWLNYMTHTQRNYIYICIIIYTLVYIDICIYNM